MNKTDLNETSQKQILVTNRQYPAILTLQCINEVLAATLTDGRSVVVPLA
jgi:hypothetical protein